MARKPASDPELFEALWQVLVEEDPDAVRQSKRVILGALCNGSLPSWAQCLIAGDLRRYWFNTKARDRAIKSQVVARGLEMEIERAAKERGISKAQAKAKVAAKFKTSVPTLEQRLRRARRGREKG